MIEYVLMGILGGFANVLYSISIDRTIDMEDYKNYLVKIGIGAVIGVVLALGLGGAIGLSGLGGALISGYLGLDLLDVALRVKEKVS